MAAFIRAASPWARNVPTKRSLVKSLHFFLLHTHDFKVGYARTYLAYTSGAQKKKVTLIPGDGIGPEIVSSVMGVFRAANVPIEWEIFDVSLKNTAGPQISQEVVASISRNKVAIKGMYVSG